MSDAEPEKRSMWRKAIACFWSHRKAWLREAALFMLLFFALDLFAFRDTFLPTPATPPVASEPAASAPKITDEQLAQIKAKDAKLGAMLENQMKALNAQGLKDEKTKPDIPSQILQIIAGLVMAYFFALFFLNEELRRGLSRSWSGFFFFLMEIVLAALLTVVAVAIPVITFVVVGRFVMPENALPALAGVVGAGIAIYMSTKLSPVGIMAVDRAEDPIRESWALTNGNFWRIFGNGLMVSLVLLPVMLVSTVALAAVPYAGVPGKLLAMAVHAVLSVAYSGVFMAFGCTVYRTLYEERPKVLAQG